MYSCILQTKKRCKCEFKLQIKEWKKKKKESLGNNTCSQAKIYGPIQGLLPSHWTTQHPISNGMAYCSL